MHDGQGLAEAWENGSGGSGHALRRFRAGANRKS
jgi:hypothetical protein